MHELFPETTMAMNTPLPETPPKENCRLRSEQEPLRRRASRDRDRQPHSGWPHFEVGDGFGRETTGGRGEPQAGEAGGGSGGTDRARAEGREGYEVAGCPG